MTLHSPLVDKAKAFRAAKIAGGRLPAEAGGSCVADSADLARLLSEEAAETDTFLLAGAILNDILQITESTEAELVSVFGSEIAFVVAEVTDNPRFSSVTRKALRMLAAPHMSRKARLIKLAEVIESVRALAGPAEPALWSVQHKLEYFDWAERLVQAMGKTSPTLEAVFTAEIERARLALGSHLAVAE